MVTQVAGWESAISRIKAGTVVVTPRINQCSADFSSNVESGERQSNNVEPGERGKLQNNAHRPLPTGVEQNTYFILSPSLSLAHQMQAEMYLHFARLVGFIILAPTGARRQNIPFAQMYLLPFVKGAL